MYEKADGWRSMYGVGDKAQQPRVNDETVGYTAQCVATRDEANERWGVGNWERPFCAKR